MFKCRKPKAQQVQAEALYTHHDADRSGSELSDTKESFCLQMKIEKTQSTQPQVPKPVYLMANFVYHLQLHHKRNQYLHARLDTCANVNLMPMAVYCLMFKDPGLRKLTPSSMEIETYTNDVVKIIGTCQFYLVHPESKQLIKAIFFVTKENWSVLLSCRTTMELGLIKPHAQLDYLPPRVSLLTTTCDRPSKTKTQKPNIQCMIEKPTMVTIPENAHARALQLQNAVTPKDNRLITRKEQIMARFPDVFEGIGKFQGKPYKIQLDPNVPPKQTPCRPVPIHLKEAFKTEIDKMLKAEILKPVQEASPWMNSFVLIEGTNKQGKPKLRICLDPTNLNKAIIREPYHFKTPEDISHLLADSRVMTVLDCKKGYWHQELDKASSYLTTFNTEFGRYQYTVMLFGTTIASGVFQKKLDQCFGHLQNVIVIADDIMVVGKQPNHKDHDLALTILLNTTRKCNIWLNYEKL